MPVIYDVEIGYAFYEGNAQVWATSTFEVEVKGTSEDDYAFEIYLEMKATKQLLKEVERQGVINIAGTWLHSFDENELSRKLECPQCHEYEDETQIADHGVCRDCMQQNYEGRAIYEEDK